MMDGLQPDMAIRSGAAALCAIFLATALHGAVSQKERDALTAFYAATGGASWTARDNWNGAAGTECTWYGVYCDESQSKVVGLSLNYNNLTGTIPSSIADLSNVQTIELQGNSLSGTIPSQIASLTQLERLDLAYNQLTGAIPSTIGSLAALKFLYLHGNQFTGSIPSQIGNLSQLEDLNLSDDQLTGAIPASIGSLASLKYLSLGVNSLDGPIPSTFGNLRNLVSLDLSSNKLTGPIPAEIGNLTQLTGLYLASNSLSGAIPSGFYSLAALENADLSYNGLTGSISNDIGRLTALIGLRLNDNQLSGAIPPALTSLAQLQLLDLSTNGLTGSLPADFDRLSNLTYLSLSVNNFSGPIPPSIGRLSKLENLYLYDDHLAGAIPSELGSLTNLKELVLDNNRLTGPIPDSFRNLRNLEKLTFYADDLTGQIPAWIGELSKLTFFSVNSNRMTGPIPDSLWTLTALEGLDLAYNVFSGTIPPAIGNMTRLNYLSLSDNELTGVLPDELWTLHELGTIAADKNQISGRLSGRVAELTKLETLLLGDNELSGAIPPELGSMRQLVYLQLYGNQFSGTIPPQLGDLSNLQLLDLGSNNLRGEVPASMLKLTSLPDRSSGWDHNALYASDPNVLAFLNQKNADGDFNGTQTVAVTNVAVTATSDRSVTLQWTPIVYSYDYGGYQVAASRSPGGTPEVIATTSSKYDESITVRNLQASTTYYFTIRSITFPHDIQRNTVVSDPTVPISSATTAKTVAPPDVVVTTQPNGIVEIDGVPQDDDTFTLTNFGDAPTDITLSLYLDFFTVSPQSFTLAPGASQLVTVSAKPNQAAGVYYGGVTPQGQGVAEGEFITVSLLSVSRPAQGAVAEALASRVEVVDQPGIPAAGTISFRNRGTVGLSGVLQSDVPWIVPPRYVIQIGPGEEAAVTFTIDSAKRPQTIGTLTGTLTLVYVSGELAGASRVAPVADAVTTSSGTSSTRVTVVAVTKPPVSTSSVPPLSAGEVAFAIPGIIASKAATSSVASDLDILNAFGSRGIDDLRLYFSAPSVSSVATLDNLGSNQTLSFANIVSNVYGAPAAVGSLQMRTREWQNLLIASRLLRLSETSGIVAGDLPVFRSDRVMRAGQTVRLAGMRQSSTSKTTLFVQEMTGVATRAHLDYLDASGQKLGQRDADVAAFGFAQIDDGVPSGAVTALVRNSGTEGGLVSYARVSDQASGDSWSIVDWRSYFDFRPGSALLVPFVQTTTASTPPPSSPGHRRAVSHASSTTTATEVTLFNGSATDPARVVMQYGSTQRDLVIAPQSTSTVDVAAMFTTSGTGPLRITQDRGDVAVTTRISRPAATGGAYGSAVPVVAARSGLRAGQSRVFANIEDPSAATVAASTPGTFRATYGLIETSGATVTVRVSVSLPSGRALVDIAKNITLAPNQFVTFDGVVKSIIGESRDAKYGDFHNLQVRFDAISGDGSVVPFFVITENATDDSVLRLE